MAEGFAVLGAVSSVLQVVDFSMTLVVYTKEIIRSGSSATKETADAERLARAHRDLAQVISDAVNREGKLLLLTTSGKKVLELANQCHREAQALLDELNKLQIDDASSGWDRVKDGTKSAARFMRKKGDIERRQRTLNDLSNALQLAMVAARDDARKDIRHSILESLAFPGMPAREKNVVDAHAHTFDWALEADAVGLKQWLRSGTGMFWITGKAGSGKSTLVKYLATSQSARAMLRAWAGDQELAIASFYFWYLGSDMQKSTDGLLRTILHTLLSTHPVLALDAYPDQFEKPARLNEELDCSAQSLLQVLIRLSATAAAGYDAKKLCFFIDGLDEYNGNHLELVQLMNKMAWKLDIKLCVSSRPWNVFTGAFEGRVPLLRMEELTRNDIHLFVYDKVLSAIQSRNEAFGIARGGSSYDRDDLRRFIEHIAEMAEGVFLWVFLVVQDMLVGINEGDAMHILERRVKLYPRDLEDFFRVLVYDRVDRVYAQHTSQALVLAHTYAKVSSEVSESLAPCLTDYWLMFRNPDGIQDADFAYSLQAKDIPPDVMATMVRQTKSQLSSTCKDLLVLETNNKISFTTKVRFLHRTVYDFLDNRDIKQTLSSKAPSFFDSSWILYLFALARIKCISEHLRQASPRAAIPLINACFDHVPEAMSRLYVQEFESAIIPCLADAYGRSESRLSDSDVDPSAIANLLAFRSNVIVNIILEASPSDMARGKLGLCIIAALGKSRLNNFSLLKVDLEILQKLIARSPTFSDSSSQDSDSSNSPCYSTPWEFFLRTFYLEYEAKRDADSLQMTIDPLLIRGWAIAKMFLAMRVPLDARFCISELEDGNHEHEWRTALLFLRQRFPQEWLSESDRLKNPFMSWVK